MSIGTESVVKQIVLSPSAFGPNEIVQIVSSIGKSYSNYRELREAARPSTGSATPSGWGRPDKRLDNHGERGQRKQLRRSVGHRLSLCSAGATVVSGQRTASHPAPVPEHPSDSQVVRMSVVTEATPRRPPHRLDDFSKSSAAPATNFSRCGTSTSRIFLPMAFRRLSASLIV